MSALIDKQISPLTGLGFQELFGMGRDRVLLIGLPNQILPEKRLRKTKF